MTQAASHIPATAAQARDRVNDLLKAHPGAVEAMKLTDALLITSELVTNAQRHTDGLIAFTARIRGNRLTLLVEDASPHHPVTASRHGPGDIGGYGWPMVRQLATSVTIVPAARGGKVITVTLDLS
ncbi:ATP-binding protein [Streptomyces sp. NPDC048197]|uniref:ATP-binding protein n=1 Tax=Streptomyces sp. NPDC048197 TaxID=3365511 RepID=UPI003716EBB3